MKFEVLVTKGVFKISANFSLFLPKTLQYCTWSLATFIRDGNIPEPEQYLAPKLSVSMVWSFRIYCAVLLSAVLLVWCHWSPHSKLIISNCLVAIALSCLPDLLDLNCVLWLWMNYWWLWTLQCHLLWSSIDSFYAELVPTAQDWVCLLVLLM